MAGSASNKNFNYSSGERRGGKVIKEYVYDDEHGNPYHRIERTENKQFPQSTFIPAAIAGEDSTWKPGAPKFKIPYHLPVLLEADPEEPVFICEGEKDADNLEDAGMVSTTNPGGAGKWTKELNKWFKGKKRVYILQDNDEPGRQHAQQVHEHLVDVVDFIQIIDLPDLQEGGDVSDWLENGGNKKKLLEFCTTDPKALLETIILRKGFSANAVKSIEQALIAAQTTILIRGDELVEPIWHYHKSDIDKDDAGEGSTKITILKRLTIANLSHIINRDACTFKKMDRRTKKFEFCDPPVGLIQQLLEKGHWEFPRVAGTINAPTLRPDGSLFDQPGLDPKTRLWRWKDTGLDMPKLPSSPTKKMAQEALALLKDLLIEVAFETDVDRSVALAAILCTIVRGAFEMAPIFLFAAHTAGTGKSYLVDIIAHIAQGRWCPVMELGANEEAQKRIASLLMSSPPIISLDNLEDDLKGQSLCHITERPLVQIRKFGTLEMAECEWRGTLFATGNNIQLEGDMVRRGLTCNLDSTSEVPENRKFKFDPIDDKIKKERGKYVAAALIIVRAYIASGTKVRSEVKEHKEWGSYRGFSRFVREPLVWLGEPDPYLSVEKARAEDPSRNAISMLYEQWQRHLDVKAAYRVNEIITKASETSPNGPDLNFERSHPEFFELLVEQAGASRPNTIDSRRLGGWFRRINGQRHAGFRLRIKRQDNAAGHLWELQKISAG